jgi:hypothetical protein
MGDIGTWYIDPLQYGMNTRLADPSMDPNYAYYKAGVNATNSWRYSNYLKRLKIQDIAELQDKMDYGNLMADVDKYIKYAKDDYITWLGKIDNNLADALQQATESYWAGNLIGSGIQAERTTEMINEWEMEKWWLKVEKKRTMDKYNDERNRAIAKYEQITKPVNAMNRAEIKYRPIQLASRESFAQAPQNYIPQ